MSQVALPQELRWDFIKQLRWDAPYNPAQDRFFAWCGVALIDQDQTTAAKGQFAVEKAPGIFHPGATSSWKQIQFGEAIAGMTDDIPTSLPYIPHLSESWVAYVSFPATRQN